MQTKPLPNHEHHTMRHVGSRTNYHEFVCDICGRHLLLHSNPSIVAEGEEIYVVLSQGDIWASHSGAMGGLVINGIDIKKEQTELSNDWNKWLADVLDDAEFGL